MNDLSVVNSNVSDIAVAALNPSPVAPTQPATPKQPSIYEKVPDVPLFDAVEVIKYDFNHGIRVLFPHNGKEYHCRFSDIDTGIILYSADTVPGAYITSVKKFYIKFRLQIFVKGGTEPIFTHDYDATDREIMIQLPVGTIGDSIGWFSYVERFQQKHHCKVICVMTPRSAILVKNQYPEITFIGPDDTLKFKPYASYYMGLFFKGDVDNQPIDFRYIGLCRIDKEKVHGKGTDRHFERTRLISAKQVITSSRKYRLFKNEERLINESDIAAQRRLAGT